MEAGLRSHIFGLWVFSAALVGFLALMIYLTLNGQHLAVQRLGSLMVFVGTLSAFELINDRRQVAGKRHRAEITRLQSRLSDTRRWVATLQSAIKRLVADPDMNLDTALRAKQGIDAKLALLEKRLEEEDNDSEDEIETIDLHAGLNTFFLIGTGTLVWGYGDLASAWLARVLSG